MEFKPIEVFYDVSFEFSIVDGKGHVHYLPPASDPDVGSVLDREIRPRGVARDGQWRRSFRRTAVAGSITMRLPSRLHVALPELAVKVHG